MIAVCASVNILCKLASRENVYYSSESQIGYKF